MTPRKITNKYDLLHRNTPKYARTTIEWDCGLLTPITKNRVLKWLKDPTIERTSRGDAADMFYALRRQFKIPRVAVPVRKTSKYSGNPIWSESLSWDKNVSAEVMEQIQLIYTSERVQQRLSGEQVSWMFDKDTPQAEYFWLASRSEHDLEPLLKAIHNMMESEEYAKKVNDAVEFVNNGGKLYFTYDPTDRTYDPERV